MPVPYLDQPELEFHLIIPNTLMSMSFGAKLRVIAFGNYKKNLDFLFKMLYGPDILYDIRRLNYE